MDTHATFLSTSLQATTRYDSMYRNSHISDKESSTKCILYQNITGVLISP